MSAVTLFGRSLRLFVQRAGVCRRVLEQCCLSTTSVAAQKHTSLQQFTDDETMMRDTGLCLLLLLLIWSIIIGFLLCGHSKKPHYGFCLFVCLPVCSLSHTGL